MDGCIEFVSINCLYLKNILEFNFLCTDRTEKRNDLEIKKIEIVSQNKRVYVSTCTSR